MGYRCIAAVADVRLDVLAFQFFVSVFVASQGKQIVRLYLKCYVLLIIKFNDHTIIKIMQFKYEMQI